MLSAFLLPFLCLTGTLSCSGLKKFPTDKLYEFDPKAQVCAEYQIIDFEKFKFKHVRDIAIDQCPAIFGFTSSDIPIVLQWSEDAIQYSKQRCR